MDQFFRDNALRRRATVSAFAVCIALAGAFGSPSAADARAESDLLLLVGNSFTKGVKKPLKALIKSSGRRVKISSSVGNGFTFAKHLQSGKAAKKIQSKPWNYVVLQEQSLGLFHTRYPEARNLDQLVRASGSKTMFFMTWRDRGMPVISYESLRGDPGEDVGYVPIGYELGAAVAPIGWAFRNAVEDYPAIELWGPDGHHAGRAGDYLAAAVLFVMIYGESPVGLWGPGPLTDAEVLYFQELAASTVFSEIDTWMPPGH